MIKVGREEISEEMGSRGKEMNENVIPEETTGKEGSQLGVKEKSASENSKEEQIPSGKKGQGAESRIRRRTSSERSSTGIKASTGVSYIEKAPVKEEEEQTKSIAAKEVVEATNEGITGKERRGSGRSVEEEITESNADEIDISRGRRGGQKRQRRTSELD
ncbi:hypothetical protein HPP92_015657 [Vanilla planifolia]|uniref:Uncharacterized protein n=1 Tax=Vanilla planifolia TaxID=51239 RepID=A0A835UVB4_VANPL|nr:hypothetical protein HPP92_015657 [Vanilla planifolia]